MPAHRLHILGASGSGTSTLGQTLAHRLACPFLDVDTFFWLPTTPPFQSIRPRDQRQSLLANALAASDRWTLSGSLCGWGDPFIPLFDCVIFLWIPPDLRLARLRAREAARYGDAILPNGPMHAAHLAFLQWAASYDQGDLSIRSRALHEQWLAALPCPVIRLEGDLTPQQQLERVLQAIQ